MVHGHKDDVTGRYWNSITNKYVVRLRDTAKGKTKGDSYKKRLNVIKGANSHYKSHGWLPIGVTIEDLLNDASQYWKFKHQFEIDKAISVFTLIIVKRCKISEFKKGNYYFKDGYVGIHSNELRNWCDAHWYLDYLSFLEERSYIRTFRTANDTKPYVVGQLPIMYKIATWRLRKEGDRRMFHKVEYTTAKTLVKVFNYKRDYKLSVLKRQVRKELVENVYKLTEQMAADSFASWALANPSEFKTKKKDGLEEANRLIVRVEQMKEGSFTINPKDVYSGRFHPPFTYTKKCIRRFIRIDNEMPREIDIKNSQFFLLSLLRSHSKQVKPVLRNFKEHNPGSGRYTLVQTLELLQHYYDTYSDVKLFLDTSADGSVYQVMQQQYSKKKKYVKDLCFKALFSADGECAKSKTKLKRFYPNVVKFCELVNTYGKYPLPQILQTLESRIYLDIVALEAIQNGAAPFITVHDAYYIKPCDEALFASLIVKTFNKLELPVPKVDVK